jgi:general secretion pathway protein G
MRPKRSRRSGFTLVELVVVVLVLGILAAIAAPRLVNTATYAKTNSTKASLNIVRDAIELYKGDNGSYPPAATLATALKPYLKGPFPAAQIGNTNANVATSTQNPISAPEAGGAGWAYTS